MNETVWEFRVKLKTAECPPGCSDTCSFTHDDGTYCNDVPIFDFTYLNDSWDSDMVPGFHSCLSHLPDIMKRLGKVFSDELTGVAEK